MIKTHKSYVYANGIANNNDKDYRPPHYVIKQCKEFLDIANNKNDKYEVDENKVKKIDNLLKLLIMPKGLKAGQTLYDCTVGYQWLFYVSVLCVVHKSDPDKRRYETAILEIARKNFKTYTVATIFILLFLLEPNFSSFFSVAPDGALSREIKEAIENTLKSSPQIYEFEGKKRFKILRDSITCLLTDTVYKPLAYTNNKFDGKLPNVFLADEVGALPNSYAIEAMRSGQLNIKNKLGCIISTKYPTSENPFEDEVLYAKKVLDGEIKDEKIFALLYEPDTTKDWLTDDNIMKQANPASIEIVEIWNDLIAKRKRAIQVESARENFLTKHCNIIYQSKAEKYIDVETLKECSRESIDFRGKELYVGVDLSQSNDNTAVSIVAIEDGKILADSYCFIPEGRIREKIETEKIDYISFIEKGKCFACGDMNIDYGFVEKFVFDLEAKTGGIIKQIGYDKWNAISSAMKWQEKYNVVEIRQHSDTLYPATKLLREQIENKEFSYCQNKLLEINFNNAKCVYDNNMNYYINKKKSTGKIDMVASLINAIVLANQSMIFGDDWSVQV